MITNEEIERMPLQAMPIERVRLQRLVDRIRYAESGGVRDSLRGLCKPGTFRFFGIESASLTRDELIGLIIYTNEDRYPVTLTNPDLTGARSGG